MNTNHDQPSIRTYIAAGFAGLLIFVLILIISAIPARGQIWPDCATGQGNLNNMSLIIPTDSVDMDLFGGALVGAFTPAGDCVGMTYFHGNPNVNQTLNIIGADETAPDPRGAAIGDAISIRILTEIVPALQTGELESGQTSVPAPLVYKNDGIFVIRDAGLPSLADAQAEIAELQNQLAAANAELSEVQQELSDVQQQLADMTAARDGLQDRLTEELANLQDMTDQRDALTEDLAAEEARFQALSDRIQTVIAILQSPL